MRSLFIIISMIKVAILEYEKETKDIVFQLSKLFMHEDWCFRHYLKASDLAKRMKESINYLCLMKCLRRIVLKVYLYMIIPMRL